MADNIENQQPTTNPVEEIKFIHEGSVQFGCKTGMHELEITKLSPGDNGMTLVLMMCRVCGQNFESQEKLNLNDVLGGTNVTTPITPQQPQPINTTVGSGGVPVMPPQKPQQPQVAPISPIDAFKDADSFWEAIKRGK